MALAEADPVALAEANPVAPAGAGQEGRVAQEGRAAKEGSLETAAAGTKTQADFPNEWSLPGA